MMICGVYSIQNTMTGRTYIGSSENVKDRLTRHKRLLAHGKHHSRKLQKDYDLYGAKAFKAKILLICRKEDLLFFEQRAIRVFNSVNVGYNVAEIAGAPMRGRKHTDETKKKMSKASKGKKKSPEHAKHIGDVQRGKPLSPEHREKIKEAWKVRRLTPVSEETREKLSEAGKGRPVSPKSLARLIARNRSWKGKKRGPLNITEEQRQRQIASNKARKGSKQNPERAEEVKAGKQAKWAERKAKGLHTRRWYTNRGFQVPEEIATSESTTDGSTSPTSPTEESHG